MRILALLIAIVAITSTAYAGPTERQDVGGLLYRDTYVQGFSPNGDLSSITGTAATMHNLTNYLAYAFYCPVTCYLRLAPTSSKGSAVQVPMPSGQWFSFVKHTATPFVNISTSTGASPYWMQQ